LVVPVFFESQVVFLAGRVPGGSGMLWAGLSFFASDLLFIALPIQPAYAK